MVFFFNAPDSILTVVGFLYGLRLVLDLLTITRQELFQIFLCVDIHCTGLWLKLYLLISLFALCCLISYLLSPLYISSSFPSCSVMSPLLSLSGFTSFSLPKFFFFYSNQKLQICLPIVENCRTAVLWNEINPLGCN